MDHRNFDDVTRAVAAEGGTRRALVRLLAGSVPAGVAARLGLTEDVAAEGKHKKAKGKRRKSTAERKGHGQLQAEGKRRKKKKHKKRKPEKPPQPPQPPQPPDPDTFACPAAARCQILQEDTAAERITLESCPGDGGARTLCAAASKNADFRALLRHLSASGFALTGDPDPLIDFYEVRQDGTRVEDVFLLRFARAGSGETVLLRYGEDANTQQAATYAFLQQGEAPTAVLAVSNGAVEQMPLGLGGSGGASRASSRSARRGGGLEPESHDPDSPYDGQADELCSQCSLVCRTLGAIECNALVLLLSGGSATATAFMSPLCNKPAEAECPSYCNLMVKPLLEDDPKNCGACGQSCGLGEHCCAGQCKGNQCCSDVPPPCSACSSPVCVEGGWLCRPDDAYCGRDYDTGEDICCPSGSGCDVSGKCCGLPDGCVCPIGYSPCPGWPQGCCKE